MEESKIALNPLQGHHLLKKVERQLDVANKRSLQKPKELLNHYNSLFKKFSFDCCSSYLQKYPAFKRRNVVLSKTIQTIRGKTYSIVFVIVFYIICEVCELKAALFGLQYFTSLGTVSAIDDIYICDRE